MTALNEAQSNKPQLQAANNGVVIELNDEALYNLTGFFDVLIQMDLAQKQRNEEEPKDETVYKAKDS